MLFNQKEFEHNIQPDKLKKGLKLVKAHKVELLNNTITGSYTFLVGGRSPGEISIQLKAGKITGYKCSCDSKKYCEHLAACLFYLQKETFEFIRPEIRKEKNKIIKAKENALNHYTARLKAQLRSYIDINKLSNRDINEISKKIDKENEKATYLKQSFYFDLAMILELPKLFSSQVNEDALKDLFGHSKKKVLDRIVKRLSDKEKAAIIDAAEYSVRSQNNFRTGVFSILIPYACIFIKEKNDFLTLKEKLKKRNQNKNKFEQIDRKLVSELQLSIMHTKLVGKRISLKDHENAIELPIALAELEFCKKKNEKGFEILSEHAAHIKKKNINKYLDLIEEILFLAKEKNNRSVEIDFLEEKFVYGYVVNEKQLEYFFTLHNEAMESVVTRLLKRLKKESRFYTFEKTAVVLLDQKRYKELIEEIKREKNKFKLLNTIAKEVLPDDEFIKLYIKHLLQAITEAKYPYFQEEIFNLAIPYLNNLEKDIARKAIQTLKEKLMYDRYMLSYVNKLYP